MSCDTVKVVWAICLEIAFPSKALLIVLFELHRGGQSHFQQMYYKRPEYTGELSASLVNQKPKIGSLIDGFGFF